MCSVTRFKAPQKIHILSWALALERDGSVACHFKDCQFMALSLEEMGNHYPFCSCENNKYPFVCETCSRRTDAMEKLLLHKLYSHSYKPTDEESRKIDDYLMIPTKKDITSVLRRSWEIFLEKKKYLKCLMRKCLFVTNSIESMEDHYLSSCKETFWSQLKYECEFCNGRLLNDYDLKMHIQKAHESKIHLMKNNAVQDSNLKRVQIWSEEIMLHKQGRCFVNGCQFVDNYVKILEKHHASCDGTKKNFIICSACGSWLLNETRLNEHKRCFHKDLDEEDFKKLAHKYELELENQNNIALDDMSSDENDPHRGIKRFKTEDSMSQNNSVIADIPLLYLQPGKWSPSPEDFLEDPLSLDPSTNKKTSVSSLQYCIADSKEMRNFSIDDTISFKPEISSQGSVPLHSSALTGETGSVAGPSGQAMEKRLRTSPGTSGPMSKRAKCGVTNKTAYANATGGSRVAIIPNEYPSIQLSREQVVEVEKQLELFLDQIDEKTDLQPEFSGASYYLGGCIILCDNEDTKTWLLSVVERFTISGGIKLRAGKVEELRRALRVGAYFPGDMASEEQVLKRLRIQNRKVPNISDWTLMGTKTERSGFYGIFRVPETSIKYIEGKGMQMSYGCHKISLKVFEKKPPKLPTKDLAKDRTDQPRADSNVQEETATLGASEPLSISGEEAVQPMEGGSGEGAGVSPDPGTSAKTETGGGGGSGPFPRGGSLEACQQ